jgi:hypothetical protein
VIVTGIISTIGMLPAGALLMRPRGLARALWYGGLYAALLVSILWLVVVGLQRWYGAGSVGPFIFYVGLSSLMLGFAGTLILAAVAARLRGYRLVWGRGADVQ